MRTRQVDEWHGNRLKSHLGGGTIPTGVHVDVWRRYILKSGEGFEYLHLAIEASQGTLQELMERVQN